MQPSARTTTPAACKGISSIPHRASALHRIPKGEGKMVIRGGYGIFFEHTNGNEGNSESLEGSAPLVLTSQQFNVVGIRQHRRRRRRALPAVLHANSKQGDLALRATVEPQRAEGTAGPHHCVGGLRRQQGYAFDTAKQREPACTRVAAADNPFPAGTPITRCGLRQLRAERVRYPGVGNARQRHSSSGAAVPNLWVACGNNPDPLRTNFPGASNITQLEDQANSIYHSLQVSAQRTVGALTLSFSYTYSHSIDDSSDRFDNAFVNAYRRCEQPCVVELRSAAQRIDQLRLRAALLQGAGTEAHASRWLAGVGHHRRAVGHTVQRHQRHELW